MGSEVYGISLPNHNAKALYNSANLSEIFAREYFLNIESYQKVNKAIIEISPDYVFHFAAQSLVIESMYKPLKTFSTNIMGTLNILHATLNQKKIQGIAIATTDKVYKSKDSLQPSKELDELGGLDPYSASKAATEIAVASMAKSNNPSFIPVATLRAGNVIGGGDYSDNRLIPDLCRAVELQKTMEIRYPNATRPWQHVLDCLWGYILVAERQIVGRQDLTFESYNFGSAGTRSVQEIIAIFSKAYEKEFQIRFINPQIKEQISLILDSSKAERELGWRPLFSVESTVINTAEFYKRVNCGSNVRALAESLITDYLFKLKERDF